MTFAAVRHLVLAFDIGVVAGRDFTLVDREAVLVLLAFERWLFFDLARDAFGLESPLGQDIGGIGAFEARELGAAIVVNGSFGESGPIVPGLLLGVAVIVGVARDRICVIFKPACCENRGSGGDSQDDCGGAGVMHFGLL